MIIHRFLNENALTELQPETFYGLESLRILLIRTNMLNSITNNTFSGLKTLRLLSLYDNKISCVQKGSLSSLVALKTLNLMSNPLVCSCQMKWLKDWIDQNKLATGNLKCTFPMHLNGKSIQLLGSETFADCRSGSNEECTNVVNISSDKIVLNSAVSKVVGVCPQNCTCRNNIVRCSRSNMKSIPDHIAESVQELYLDSNEITEIPAYIKRLTNLEKLDLSFNKIRFIPENIFESLTKLDTLIISFNSIQCVQERSFAGLKKLRMLSLYGNNVSTIPDKSFRDLRSLSHM